MKKTKFIKRLLNFFMPSKQHFINMEWVGHYFDSSSKIERGESALRTRGLQLDQDFAQLEGGAKGSEQLARRLFHVRPYLCGEQRQHLPSLEELLAGDL